MDRLSVVGLMYTRTCPLECQHCISNSSPKIRERMQFREAMEYVQIVPGVSDQICFTGGEPFLFFKDHVELVRQAKALGLVVSLVSGAGWVRTESGAARRVRAIAQAGLTCLCISWDQYHEAYTSPDRATMLARLAIEAGLKVRVRVTVSGNCSGERHQKLFEGLPVTMEYNSLVRLGRAETLEESHFVTVDEPPRGTCSIVYSPIVEPDGNVFACCGPAHFCRRPSPLYLGNAKQESLGTILRRALEDPVLDLIHNLGPYGLYHLLKDMPEKETPKVKKRGRYASICELCLDLTNDPLLVDTIRQTLSNADIQRLVAASRLRTKALASSQKSAYVEPALA